MKEKIETTKLEFLMTLNDNFVVQRYFNVKGYNPKARKSVELYSIIRDVAEKIQEDLTFFLEHNIFRIAILKKFLKMLWLIKSAYVLYE